MATANSESPRANGAGTEHLERASAPGARSALVAWLLETGRSLLRAVVALVVIVGLWKLITFVFNVPAFIVPPPERVFEAMSRNFSSLLGHTWVTLTEVLLGFLIAALLGLFVAVMMTASDRVSRIVSPALVVTQTVPKVAIAPLLVVWFGFGSGPIIVIVVIMAFFPITISSAVGLREVPKDLIMLGHSMGFRGLRLFLKIMFPYALGAVFAGLKVGMTLALIGSIVGEFVSGQAGLGFAILASSSAFNVDLTFGGVIAVVALGLVLFKSVELAERLMMPWRQVQSNPLAGSKRRRRRPVAAQSGK